jgi:hypothetical protein
MITGSGQIGHQIRNAVTDLRIDERGEAGGEAPQGRGRSPPCLPAPASPGDVGQQPFGEAGRHETPRFRGLNTYVVLPPPV